MTRSDAEHDETSDDADWVTSRDVDWDGVDPGLSRFNFLDPGIMPARGSERATYVDMVIDAIMPKHAREGAAWQSIKLLAATLIEAMCALVETEGYEAFDDSWKDMPASLPMLAAWFRDGILERMGIGLNADERTEAIRGGLAAIASRIEAVRATRIVAPQVEDGLRLAAASPHLAAAVADVGAALSRFRDSALKRNTSCGDFTHEDFRRADLLGEANVFRVRVVDRGAATSDLTHLMHGLIELRLRFDDEEKAYVVTANTGSLNSTKLADLKD